MYKHRGYKRETPVKLVRDYKLFAIVCEGSKREHEYFTPFRYMSKKIAVDIIDEIVSDDEALIINPSKSSPKWVLERAIRYIEKEGLSNEDELWFVMDVDRWQENQLREIAQYCVEKPNWHIVLSNPCFEVWLYLHKKSDINGSGSKSCNDLKYEISKLEKGGYHPCKFLPFVMDAIINSKKIDADIQHFMPGYKQTKVYRLVESMINITSKDDFDSFINTKLPLLIKKAKIN